jgi:hypothetical protein
MGLVCATPRGTVNIFDTPLTHTLQFGKTVAEQSHKKQEQSMPIVKELFSAFKNVELPTDGGYILSSFFEETSAYSRYEVTSYNNVKDIYQNASGDLTFMADGKKLFVLVEPMGYAKKYTEPTMRDSAHKIPYRFSELEIITTKRQDRIMVGKQPVISYTSFTILKSMGDNYSYIIYDTDDLFEVIEQIFVKTLWQDANIPKIDAEKTARYIKTVFDGFVQFKIQ